MRDVPPHLCQHALVVVAVQERVLVLARAFPPRPPVLGAECLYVSRQACSSTTISRRVDSFSAAVRGALGATGIMVGFMGGEGGAARLRDEEAAAAESVLPEGTNAGEAPESGVEEDEGLEGVAIVDGWG